MMVLSNLNGNLPENLISQISWLVTILQAVGGFIILYIIFNIVNTLINKKRLKQIDEITNYLKRIEKILKDKK